MYTKVHKHFISFTYATEGMMWAFKNHQNYQIHFVLSICTLMGAFILRFHYLEWILIILTITLGFVIETINTSIEAVCDAVDKSWREDIKIAKDVSAAAMLIYSIGALLIACILFIPKIVV